MGTTNNHLSILVLSKVEGINNHLAFPSRPNAPKSTASRHTCHSRAGGNPLRHTQYDIRYTIIANPTLAHFRHFSSLFTNFPSTFVVSALQISTFMQNKPNLRNAQMNVSRVSTKDYEKRTLGERGKNKPNSNPIQTQSNPIKANKMPKQTQFKPNTNPNKPNFKGKKSSWGGNDRIEQSAIPHTNVSNICRLTAELIGSTLLIVNVFEGFTLERIYYGF
ncbi:MAG TPA: hypothetical protein HPP66_08040 [Planctomycetes bacterium]|nr:hypothetical protein [Planctomycetota bacterium]